MNEPKTKRLCEHVRYRLTPKVTMFKGVATPNWGWDVDLQADVPILSCSICPAVVRIPFLPVQRADKRGRHRG